MKKKIRPLGLITSDLEPLWFELLINHQLQIHEVVGIFVEWARIHCPCSIEIYEDNSSPLIYGPKIRKKYDKKKR